MEEENSNSEDTFFASKEEEEPDDSGFITGTSVSLTTPSGDENKELNDGEEMYFDAPASKPGDAILSCGEPSTSRTPENKSDTEICDGVEGKCKINSLNGEGESSSQFQRSKYKFRSLRGKSRADENVDAESGENLPSDAKKQKKEKVEDDCDSFSSSEFSDSEDSDSDPEEVEEEEEKLDLNRRKKSKEELEEEDRMWLQKDVLQLPGVKWKMLREMEGRETGLKRFNWTERLCGSRSMLKRLELQQNMKKHEGCVNAIHFNQTGSLLASGSDDLNVILWDWCAKGGNPVVTYESGHRSNVFQAKFMPNCGDSTVVSTARDGQVRVADISSTGSCKGTKKVAQHRGSAHKLSLYPGCRSTLLSCGEDGVVMGIDLRQERTSQKLVTVKSQQINVPLYSVHTNPFFPHEFAVSGKDRTARIFDERMLLARNGNTETVKTFCPHHIDSKLSITCLMYNWCGSELLCSYCDEDIYLFDVSHSSGANYIKRYKGHRNNVTVKGVNFYGPRSEYIVSGSDCGNIFFWEKQSAKIIHLREGDKGGVVNVLEPHPSLPVLATSGLDHDIKIWGPSGDPFESAEEKKKIKEQMINNRHQSVEDDMNMSGTIDGHLLWFLMRSLRRRAQSRPATAEQWTDADSSSDDSDSAEDNPQEACTQS